MAYHCASQLFRTAETEDALRSIGAEAEGGKVVLYRSTDIPDQTAGDLRYGDFLSSVAGGVDATGNLGASSYGKYVYRFELPVGDIQITNGELQYKGRSRSLDGGGYPEAVYRAYNDAMGSNYTAEEIDGMPAEEVRSVARMALEGGGEEFDQLVGRTARAAIRTLLAKKKERPERTTSGFYNKRLKDVVGGLRGWMLQFSSLLLHRLVEEHRYAVMLAEVEEGRTIHMSRNPEMESPDEENEGTDIGQWSLENIGSIKRMLRTRHAKTKNLHDEFKKLGKAMQDAKPWLETTIPIYSKHMSNLDKVSPDSDDRERKMVDRDRGRTDPDFDPKPPKISWDKKNLFSKRPEADNWLLKQWGNIYKHGENPNELTPMSLDYEAHAAASLLENRMVELRSKSWDSWSRDMESGHPAFLDAAWRLLIACKAALDEDDELVAQEWDYVYKAERGPLRITGAKRGRQQGSHTPRNERDWSQFTRVREKHTFEEKIERKKRKYKRDKLGRFTK